MLLRLKSITLLGDTNAEVKCWNEVSAFRREVLDKAWIVSAEEDDMCLREASKEKRWEESDKETLERERRRIRGKEKVRAMQQHVEKKKMADSDEGSAMLELLEKEQRSIRRETRQLKREKRSNVGGAGIAKDGDARERQQTHDRPLRKHDQVRSGSATNRGLNPANRTNYPSRAAILRAAGKYDALGI